MKKIFSALVLALSLVGMAAQAFEGVFAPDENGQMKFEPLGNHSSIRSCWEDDGEDPVPTNYSDRKWDDRNRSGTAWKWCDPGERACPKDMRRSVRYCWEGWRQGWERCGYRCRPIERCGPENGCSYPDHSRRF
ncbi:hypothetical protein [Bdellovibrio sp. HCB337]|uniref:hypothetical protein n=1 Tax=Bdellovibrio sp. HCB337 TaxID=3394358 RepID=UPI0039A75B3C